MRAFLNKKGISLSPREYFITALSYMVLGLFSSLVIGLIIKTIGEQAVKAGFDDLKFMIEMGTFAMSLMGGAIGVAIAYGLKAPPLVLFSALFAGTFGNELGGLVGAYVATVLAVELGKLVYQTTRLDIVVTPFVTILAGFAAGKFIGPPINASMTWFGGIVNWSTDQNPFVMGILIAVLMGWALTGPVSSTAIALMLGLDGLAAGAATIGCSAQMIGFAVASYRENGVGGLFSQGIGTSMLQMPNIFRKPLLLIPPTLAGIVVAPFATVWLGMTNNSSGAGMGTSGLVGQIMTFESMGFSVKVLLYILLLHIVAPAVVSLICSEFFRKKGWIKPGDMKIEYK